MWESYRLAQREVTMSLNGIMGIGISSVGVEAERKQIAQEEREAPPVGESKPDNLSKVREDYVTLQSGKGLAAQVDSVGTGALPPRGAGERGSMFHAIA
jgi:hypothetical protein